MEERNLLPAEILSTIASRHRYVEGVIKGTKAATNFSDVNYYGNINDQDVTPD